VGWKIVEAACKNRGTILLETPGIFSLLQPKKLSRQKAVKTTQVRNMIGKRLYGEDCLLKKIS